MNICSTNHVRAEADKMHCLVDYKSKINFLPWHLTNMAELQYRKENNGFGRSCCVCGVSKTVTLLNVFFRYVLLYSIYSIFDTTGASIPNRKRSFIMR